MSQLNVNIIKNRVGNNGPTISGNTTVSGILTATSFSGDGSGLTSLIISGDGNLTNLNVSGVSTFTGNTEFDGNVTIGGTLTYRDVTNIDAVGMITARKGVQILADGFTVTGVSTLSNGAFIPDNQYLNIGNDSDLRLYHTGTTSFIEDQGTGNFIIGSNGGTLKITKGADTENMAVFTPDGSAALYYDNAKKLETSTTGVDFTGDLSIDDKIVHTGDTNTAIRFPAADTFTVETAGTEQLRIDSSGNIGINCTAPGSLLELNAATATVMGISLGTVSDTITASRYIGICNGTDQTNIGTNSGFSGIEFGGPSSANEGYLAFHTHDIGVASAERLRLAKSGQIGLGGANYGTSGQVITSNGSGSAPTWQDAGGGAWELISTVNASDVSTADISGTSASYDQYCLIARRVYGHATDGYIYARVFDNGTIDARSVYNNAWVIHSSSSAGINGEVDNGASYFRVATVGGGGPNPNKYADIYIYFNNTHSGSSNAHLFQGYAAGTTGSETRRMAFSAAFNGSVTNISGLRFYFSSGNISGNLKLYGIS